MSRPTASGSMNTNTTAAKTYGNGFTGKGYRMLCFGEPSIKPTKRMSQASAVLAKYTQMLTIEVILLTFDQPDSHFHTSSTRQSAMYTLSSRAICGCPGHREGALHNLLLGDGCFQHGRDYICTPACSILSLPAMNSYRLSSNAKWTT